MKAASRHADMLRVLHIQKLLTLQAQTEIDFITRYCDLIERFVALLSTPSAG